MATHKRLISPLLMTETASRFLTASQMIQAILIREHILSRKQVKPAGISRPQLAMMAQTLQRLGSRREKQSLVRSTIKRTRLSLLKNRPILTAILRYSTLISRMEMAMRISRMDSRIIPGILSREHIRYLKILRLAGI